MNTCSAQSYLEVALHFTLITVPSKSYTGIGLADIVEGAPPPVRTPLGPSHRYQITLLILQRLDWAFFLDFRSSSWIACTHFSLSLPKPSAPYVKVYGFYAWRGSADIAGGTNPPVRATFQLAPWHRTGISTFFILLRIILSAADQLQIRFTARLAVTRF